MNDKILMTQSLLEIETKMEENFFKKTKFLEEELEILFHQNQVEINKLYDKFSDCVFILGYIMCLLYIGLIFFKYFLFSFCIACTAISFILIIIKCRFDMSRNKLFTKYFDHFQIFLITFFMTFKGTLISLTYNTHEYDNEEEILRVIIYQFFSTNLFLLIKLEACFKTSIFYFIMSLFPIIVGDLKSNIKHYYFMEGITSLAISVIFYVLRKLWDRHIRMSFAEKYKFEILFKYTNDFLVGLNGFHVIIKNEKYFSFNENHYLLNYFNIADNDSTNNDPNLTLSAKDHQNMKNESQANTDLNFLKNKQNNHLNKNIHEANLNTRINNFSNIKNLNKNNPLDEIQQKIDTSLHINNPINNNISSKNLVTKEIVETFDSNSKNQSNLLTGIHKIHEKSLFYTKITTCCDNNNNNQKSFTKNMKKNNEDYDSNTQNEKSEEIKKRELENENTNISGHFNLENNINLNLNFNLIGNKKFDNLNQLNFSKTKSNLDKQANVNIFPINNNINNNFIINTKPNFIKQLESVNSKGNDFNSKYTSEGKGSKINLRCKKNKEVKLNVSSNQLDNLSDTRIITFLKKLIKIKVSTYFEPIVNISHGGNIIGNNRNSDSNSNSNIHNLNESLYDIIQNKKREKEHLKLISYEISTQSLAKDNNHLPNSKLENDNFIETKDYLMGNRTDNFLSSRLNIAKEYHLGLGQTLKIQNKNKTITDHIKSMKNLGIFKILLKNCYPHHPDLKDNIENEIVNKNNQNHQKKPNDDRSNEVYFEVFLRKIKIHKMKIIEDLIFYDVTDLIKSQQSILEEKVLKEKIFAKIVHEFKTPLNSVVNLIGMLKKSYKNSNKNANLKLSYINSSNHNLIANQNIYLNSNTKCKCNEFPSTELSQSITSEFLNNMDLIKNLSNHLMFLISDIMNYCNPEMANSIEIHESKIPFRAVLQFCFKILKTLLYCNKNKYENVKPVLYVDEELENCEIMADEYRLKQILLNLISNSVKFTNKGSITLEAKLKHCEDLEFQNYINQNFDASPENISFKNRDLPDTDMKQKVNLVKKYINNNEANNDKSNNNQKQMHFIQIKITDSGIGIKDEDQKKVFSDFGKLNSGKENSIGTGLGLSICKALCHKMKYNIFFESKFQQGTTFTILIPQDNIFLSNIRCNSETKARFTEFNLKPVLKSNKMTSCQSLRFLDWKLNDKYINKFSLENKCYDRKTKSFKTNCKNNGNNGDNIKINLTDIKNKNCYSNGKYILKNSYIKQVKDDSLIRKRGLKYLKPLVIIKLIIILLIIIRILYH